MPIATKQPPADPITVYCTTDAANGLWSAKLSTGTVVSTESKNVANDLIAALALADQSSMVFVYSPSGNLMASCQLHDLTAAMLPNHRPPTPFNTPQGLLVTTPGALSLFTRDNHVLRTYMRPVRHRVPPAPAHEREGPEVLQQALPN
jgi:hypothetical protein